MTSFKVEDLKFQEIEEISAIHMQELREDFLPSLGKKFLDTVFYPSIHQSEYAHTFVAKEGNSVVGFVVITLNSGKFLISAIMKNMWGFFFTGLRYAFSSIKHFKNSLEILFTSFRSDKYASLGEIYVIAVRKDKQGLGAGKALVSGAIHFLKDQGSQGIKIKTLKKNEVWKKFFFNQGWILVDEFTLIQKDYVILAMKFSGKEVK